MSSLLPSNKKGVSIMIGYVILVAIAVALATAVFFYLKLYLPPQKPTCSPDIDLVIEEATCTLGPSVSNVHIVIGNRGLFTVNNVYIKIGEVDRTLRTLLNDPQGELLTSACNNYDTNLKPGAQFCGDYTYPSTPTSVQEVSVEPLVYIDNTPVLCPESIATQRIVCN